MRRKCYRIAYHTTFITLIVCLVHVIIPCTVLHWTPTCLVSFHGTVHRPEYHTNNYPNYVCFVVRFTRPR